MPWSRKYIFATVALAGFAAISAVSAQDNLPPEQLAMRTRVQTAANLAMIAEAEQDGQMMAVAAKLMSSAGRVAKPGKPAADGKPEFFDLKAMLSTAGGLGADTGKATEALAMSKPLPAKDYCAIGYWRDTCDYNNYCRWEYVC